MIAIRITQEPKKIYYSDLTFDGSDYKVLNITLKDASCVDILRKLIFERTTKEILTLNDVVINYLECGYEIESTNEDVNRSIIRIIATEETNERFLFQPC